LLLRGKVASRKAGICRMENRIASTVFGPELESLRLIEEIVMAPKKRIYESSPRERRARTINSSPTTFRIEA
jgi:hypothetical protein